MAQAPVNGGDYGGLDLDDMQGLIARAYGNLPHSRYLLCAIGDPGAARAWLGRVLPEVSTASRADKAGPSLNVAFTWAGLRRLGLGEDALGSFPKALREGMVTEHRSRILGDDGASHPTRWRWGNETDGPSAIHVLIVMFAAAESDLDAHHETVRTACTKDDALREVAEPIDGRLLGGAEHFGFADGISQPVLKGWPRRTGSVNPPTPPAPPKWSDIEPGEVVLGHADNFGKPARGATVPASTAAGLPPAPWDRRRAHLGHNGTYLVFRQLAQDVPAFHQAVATASEVASAEGRPISPNKLGAKIVGRWASGASLTLHPDSDPGGVPTNDFGYHDHDPHGFGCPVGAHVRRSNPRDSSDEKPLATLRTTMNHRILRRGRPYGLPIAEPPQHPGEEPGSERGLLFICLNSDIERQFEFVQQTWLNNPYFGGLYGEVDPLVGRPPWGAGTFTIPDVPVRRKVVGLPEFVTTKGGAYFFLPGVRALEYLATLPGSA